jgi:hypothetical protein
LEVLAGLVVRRSLRRKVNREKKNKKQNGRSLGHFRHSVLMNNHRIACRIWGRGEPYPRSILPRNDKDSPTPAIKHEEGLGVSTDA